MAWAVPEVLEVPVVLDVLWAGGVTPAAEPCVPARTRGRAKDGGLTLGEHGGGVPPPWFALPPAAFAPQKPGNPFLESRGARRGRVRMCPALAPTCPGAAASSRKISGHLSETQRLALGGSAAEAMRLRRQVPERRPPIRRPAGAPANQPISQSSNQPPFCYTIRDEGGDGHAGYPGRHRAEHL